MPKQLKIANVVGARPNFMKVAPLLEAFKRRDMDVLLIHTGQHYSEEMSRLFFEELKIPTPDINLEVGSLGSSTVQTAEIMKRFEPVILDNAPDVVLVVGDVTSTMACALVASQLGVKIAHVEAGLRSFDRTMPEEVNRILTDALSDYLFVTERSGLKNLEREGIENHKVFFVGNVMIDTLSQNLERSKNSRILEKMRLIDGEYALVTLHRPSNVDDPKALRQLLQTLRTIAQELPVIFPVHPRTRERIAALNGEYVKTDSSHQGHDNTLHLVPPAGYLDFLRLMACAKIVLTDSGGIQEETTILQVPCITLRENTERPITVEVGTNRLVGTDPEAILSGFREAVNSKSKGRIPELWDGRAAERIADILVGQMMHSSESPGE